LPEELQDRIPESLAATIRQRYAELGSKYLTEATLEDGRKINSCMFKSSINDAIEEIVDAVFNTLVWLLKLRNSEQNSESAYSAMIGLIELYALLKAELALEQERR